ncbi:hypothetical protein CRYUN_Cryun22dG0099700 [Craigia yunnanensis]
MEVQQKSYKTDVFHLNLSTKRVQKLAQQPSVYSNTIYAFMQVGKYRGIPTFSVHFRCISVQVGKPISLGNRGYKPTRHLVFSVEGRQIKSVSKIDSRKSNQVDNSAMNKEDHQPATPSYIPNAAHYTASASGEKEVLPPPIPTKSSDFGDSVAGYKDGFRPTTPGNSPGAGHSFAVGGEDIKQKSGSISSSNDKHSIAGAKEDVRPTNPGHSPGVGHVFLSKKSEPNA